MITRYTADPWGPPATPCVSFDEDPEGEWVKFSDIKSEVTQAMVDAALKAANACMGGSENCISPTAMRAALKSALTA